MSAHIIPINPKAPSAPNLDAAKIWSAGIAPPSKVGTTRVAYEASGISVLTSLGDKFEKQTKEARREAVRKAVGGAVKELKKITEDNIEVDVDASADAHAAAVASHLAQYKFNLKTSPPSRFNPNLKEDLPDQFKFNPAKPSEEWNAGVVCAEAQNFARTLTDMPANLMTPTIFCERAKAAFSSVPNTRVIVHDEEWALEKNMHTFLSVTRGTDEPAKFLEIIYNGASKEDQPMAFVGKGITFDSGGISLKPGAGMKLMRGDMGGASAVVASTLAIAQLRLPVNLITCVPLTENLPGPSATKPGDVIYAMNGKSVEVDNTDAEGRLVLADALYYTATEHKPHTLVDVATLTGSMEVALGEVFTGVFSSSDDLWEELRVAGEHEYDRMWRMPIEGDYGPQIHRSNADLCNTGGRPAGCCTAALFLSEFVEDAAVPSRKDDAEPTIRWAHLDIAGTMEATRPNPYQEVGMTGRPTRALIEFVRRMSTQVEETA